MNEHDSWLEGIGVSGFTPVDASDSLIGGAGDVVKSGLSAIGHGGVAVLDAAAGGADMLMGGVAHMGAGFLDAVGARGAAGEVRKAANTIQDAGAFNFQQAGKELGEAKDDILGGEPPSQPTPGPNPPPTPPGPKPPPSPSGNKPAIAPAGLPAPMQKDCKVVRGKVPGPANHVLCGTHGHVLDISAKKIIASSVEDYKKRFPKGGGKPAKVKGAATAPNGAFQNAVDAAAFSASPGAVASGGEDELPSFANGVAVNSFSPPEDELPSVNGAFQNAVGAGAVPEEDEMPPSA